MKVMRGLATLFLIGAAMQVSAQVLYKVEGNGLKEASYLFGTHHLAPVSVIEKFGAEAPFEETKQVVGEIDLTQDQMAMAMSMQSHMMAPADSTLSKVISKEDYALINEEFKKWAPMPGMDLSMMEPMKPMVVTTTVSLSITKDAVPDFNPAEQLDTWFQTAGQAKGKKIIPLETASQQAEILFDTTPIAWQAESLVELLKNPQKGIDNAKELTEAYLAQDLGKILSMSSAEDEHPEFMKALLDKRNADWLTKLPAIFKDGSTFVAVGALHLAGPQGLVEGLRSQGYTVTPIIK